MLDQMRIELAPFHTRHGKGCVLVVPLLTDFEFGHGDSRQPGVKMELQFGLGPRLTVTEPRTLFGVTTQTFELKPCFVIAIDGHGAQIEISAQEQRRTLGGSIDDSDHTQIPLEVDMVDHVRIQHNALIVGLHTLKARSIGPIDFAGIGLGPSRTGTTWATIKVPQIRITPGACRFDAG